MKYAAVIVFTALTGCAFGQTGVPSILTGQYNSSRTGANLQETVLTPSNVNAAQFGKLSSWAVDGSVYAQPLFVSGVAIGGVTRNVVYVATMHNSIYAFDAAQPGGAPIWKASSSGASSQSAILEPPVSAPSANGCPSQGFTGSELGILSTPVINLSTNTLYAVTATPAAGGFAHYLHAIDIRTGQDTAGSPKPITASVAGSGYAGEKGASGGQLSLSPTGTAVQRTALLLANNSIYAGFGNCGPDNDPWHGWMVGYSTSNLQQTAVFNSTPDSGMGGIWQSGRGLAADSNGNIFLTTGNGFNDGSATNFAESLLKLSPGGALVGNFPPKNIANLNNYDLDFSSSGPLMIPGTKNWVVAAGKDGIVYVLDGDALGTNTADSSAKQSFQATQLCSTPSDDGCYQIHDIAFANNYLYLWGGNDYLRSFQWNPTTNLFSTSGAIGTQLGSFHPAPLAVSGNGNQSNILWAVTEASAAEPTSGTVHAYDVSGGALTEIWNSDQNTAGRDKLPSFGRWSNPTVANGRVYIATHSNQVAVYGLLTPSDFSISAIPAAQTVVQGQAINYTVNVASQGGFNSGVAFSVSGQPANVSATFSSTSITGSGSSTLTLTASSSAPVGTYNLIITGAAGAQTHTASVALEVKAATIPDATPPSWTCCTVTSGPPRQLQYRIQDTGSGLASVTPVTVFGATYTVQPFTPGTTNTVMLTVTPKPGFPTYVRFRLTDVAGNSTLLDPYLVTDTRVIGKPNPINGAMKDLLPNERWLQIFNYAGAKNIQIEINGVLFEEAGLTNNEVRMVDIGSALSPKLSNSVVITFLGKPGGSALVSISNMVPGQ